MEADPHNTSNEESSTVKRKLSPEELEALNRRIYQDSLARKQKKIEELESKFYPTAEPAKLDKNLIDTSARRQVDEEMERRKRRSEELKNKFYKEAPPKALSQSEIEDSVRRIYADSMRVKQDKLAKLDQKYTYTPPEARKLTDEERKSSADRLSKPKKKVYTIDEINKIFGVSH